MKRVRLMEDGEKEKRVDPIEVWNETRMSVMGGVLRAEERTVTLIKCKTMEPYSYIGI